MDLFLYLFLTQQINETAGSVTETVRVVAAIEKNKTKKKRTKKQKTNEFFESLGTGWTTFSLSPHLLVGSGGSRNRSNRVNVVHLRFPFRVLPSEKMKCVESSHRKGLVVDVCLFFLGFSTKTIRSSNDRIGRLLRLDFPFRINFLLALLSENRDSSHDIRFPAVFLGCHDDADGSIWRKRRCQFRKNGEQLARASQSNSDQGLSF